MERELKAKSEPSERLEDALRIAMTKLEKLCTVAQAHGRKTSIEGDVKRPFPGTKNVPSWMVKNVRKTLLKQRKWREVEDYLAMNAVAKLLSTRIDKVQREAIDAAQIPLPGFEEFKKLPMRVGKQLFPEMTLKAVFAHRKRYEKKWDRDNQVMDELKKLTDYVRPIFEYDPSCRLAEAIAQTKKEFPARPLPKNSIAADIVQ